MAQAWMDPSGRRYQPAYTPSAGWHMAFGTSTLAVEKPGGDVDLAARERSPDGRRADGLVHAVRALDQAHGLDLEVHLPSELPQHRDVAFAVTAEVEVVADDDGLRGQPVDEHLLDEVVGGLVGARLVERQHDRGVEAGLGEQ